MKNREEIKNRITKIDNELILISKMLKKEDNKNRVRVLSTEGSTLINERVTLTWVLNAE